MKILSIDPGYDRCGIAILESIPKETLVYSACITTDKKQNFNERLFTVGKEIEELIVTHSPEQLAIENLFMSTNQKTAMHVAEVRGMILYIAKKHDLMVFEYTPLQIKTALTGHGKSDKSAVAFMTNKILNLQDEKRLDDELDAIACGLTHLAYNPR